MRKRGNTGRRSAAPTASRTAFGPFRHAESLEVARMVDQLPPKARKAVLALVLAIIGRRASKARA